MALPGSVLVREGSEASGRAAAVDNAASDLDAIFGELTHAVVNALNTISAASELSKLLIARKQPAEGSAEVAVPLARIESECMRAARLLRDGRAFMTFRIRPAQDGIDLAALLKACADSFGGSVEVDVARMLSPVSGDRDALRRAFMEVLINAFQFGAQHVGVVLKQEDAGHVVRIDFRDDGPGIQASAARLFEPFFSTHPDEHSGLGLALATRITKVHGGSIGVETGAHGATFRIELPTCA